MASPANRLRSSNISTRETHSVFPYGAAGFGAQTEPVEQSTCATAVVDEQAWACVPHVGAGSCLPGCGEQEPPSGLESLNPPEVDRVTDPKLLWVSPAAS